MAMTPEARVKKAVKKILDDLGAWYFNPSMTGFGRAGIPDFVVCWRGRFFGIECKAGDNLPTPLQQRELKGIEEHGGFSIVIRETNIHELKEKMECWVAL